MKELIRDIVVIACISVWISEASPIMPWLKARLGKKRLKPFDCAFCLSFWVSLIYFFILTLDWRYVAYAMVTSLLAVIISKHTAL